MFAFCMDLFFKLTPITRPHSLIYHIHFIANRVVKRVVGFDAFPTGRFLLTRIVEDKEYLVDDDGVIRSVENLRQLQNVKWIVLSLGGNVPWEAEKGMGKKPNGRASRVWGNVPAILFTCRSYLAGLARDCTFFVHVALLLWK